jgi:adenosylcobinamide amidohydrolase
MFKENRKIRGIREVRGTRASKVTLDGSWLDVEFNHPHSVLSWAVVGGGWQVTRRVLWHEVRNEDLSISLDPVEYFHRRIAEGGRDKSSVGFLTSAPLTSFCESIQEWDGQWAHCVATVGLSNALRAGDPSYQAWKTGTINLLVQTSVPLTLAASIEASSLIAEARTLAMLEANVLSTVSHQLATGTGTDCIAVASPQASVPEVYAGKHTLIGYLIGHVVMEAMELGIQRWKERRREKEIIFSQAR